MHLGADWAHHWGCKLVNSYVYMFVMYRIHSMNHNECKMYKNANHVLQIFKDKQIITVDLHFLHTYALSYMHMLIYTLAYVCIFAKII